MHRLFATYFGRTLNLRVRLFNILAMAGGVLSIYAALTAISEGWAHVLVCLFAAALSFGLMWFATKTGRYELSYLITILLIFFGLFPLLFFFGGGYDGAKQFMFMLAVLFTAFMLQGRRALLLVGVEIAFYCGIFVLAYLHPEWVTGFVSAPARLLDICLGFAMNSIALALCVYLYFRLYDRQQARLAEQNAELARINQQKAALIADVSHEIRTPLTVMSGYAQRARKQIIAGTANEETLQGLLTIQVEAQRLAELAQQLILTPIAEADAVPSGPVQPLKVMEQAAALVRPILAKNNNTLTLRAEKGCPCVYANAGMIAQVLVNLCVNANRHTQSGEILIAAEPAQYGKVAFCVTDDGAGIDPVLLPAVFERGVSGDGKSGLGLSICKDVVEAHHGEISLTSQPGQGTRVVFTLRGEAAGKEAQA